MCRNTIPFPSPTHLNGYAVPTALGKLSNIQGKANHLGYSPFSLMDTMVAVWATCEAGLTGTAKSLTSPRNIRNITLSKSPIIQIWKRDVDLLLSLGESSVTANLTAFWGYLHQVECSSSIKQFTTFSRNLWKPLNVGLARNPTFTLPPWVNNDFLLRSQALFFFPL